MSEADSESDRSEEDDVDVPKKAPIDQWLSGDISTVDVIDRVLRFFGIIK